MLAFPILSRQVWINNRHMCTLPMTVYTTPIQQMHLCALLFQKCVIHLHVDAYMQVSKPKIWMDWANDGAFWDGGRNGSRWGDLRVAKYVPDSTNDQNHSFTSLTKWTQFFILSPMSLICYGCIYLFSWVNRMLRIALLVC